ncbi:MAG: Na/Pi symporter [Helicobacteraceae bacterium]|nr:Na/Pi symporter [Helicobacteraceae bacterium]
MEEIKNVDLPLALAGLGMFLFGMTLIESAIKAAAGVHFKTMLKKATGTIPKALLSGVVTTAVLQSSTLVSLMIVAFVGAGLMNLLSGIAVLIGANFGSVATSWIVTMLGFKASISTVAQPIIGVAGIGLLLSGSNRKLRSFFTLAMGFGLLFFGLELLKGSMESLSNTVDLSGYHGYGVFAYVTIGFLLTAVLNSSAASIAIFLAAAGAGVIGLDIACAMVIGANMGTTITLVILSFFGAPDTKRIAVAHVAFNFGTAAIILILFRPLIRLIGGILALEGDPVLAITIFHTIFNLTGLAVFGSIVPLMTRFLAKRFVKNEAKITRYIDLVNPQMADVSVEALKNETGHLVEESMNFSLRMLNVPPKEIFLRKRKTAAIIYSHPGIIDIDVESQYGRLKTIEAAILEYSTKIGERSPEDEMILNRALAAAREATYAAKLFKDIKRNLDEFAVSGDDYMLDHYNQVRLRAARLCSYLYLSMKPETRTEKSLSKKLREILDEIQEEDKNTLNTLTKAIKSGDIAQSISPAFISMNRAVVNASRSLVECAQLLFLREEGESEGSLPSQTPN